MNPCTARCGSGCLQEKLWHVHRKKRALFLVRIAPTHDTVGLFQLRKVFTSMKASLFLSICVLVSLLCGCQADTVPETFEAPTVTTEAATQPPTEPVPQVLDWHIQAPEWFVKTSQTDDSAVWMNPKMEEDPSNIVLTISPRDTSILEMEETDFLAEMAASADENSMTVQALSVTEVDSFPALFADYCYTTSGVEVHALAYYIVASETYAFQFSDCTADGRWQEAYASAVDSIDLLLEGETARADVSRLTPYTDLHQGINLYAEEGFVNKDIQRVANYLTGNGITVQINFDMNTKGLTATEYYAKSYQQYLEYLPDLSTDKYGNLCGTYTGVSNSGNPLYSYVTAKENNGRIYLLFMSCPEELSLYYAEQFPLWASTVTFDEDAP